MAAVTTKKLRDAEVPSVVGGITWHKVSFADTNGLADNADTIELFDLNGVEIMDAFLYISATLDTNVTLRLRVGTTNLTVASTAAQANSLRLSGVPVLVSTESTVNLLVGGADIGADATVTVWIATRNVS